MNENRSALRLRLVVETSRCSVFHPLLQRGVEVEAPLGISVRTFLSGELGLSLDYVENAIQTIFLNGKAVDDLDRAVIESGSTLALSAAMPGLLGATLRRGSFYAAMRSQISYHPPESRGSGNGRIVVKLFNMLLDDVGPILLERGVWLGSRDLRELLGTLPEDFRAAIRHAELNERSIDPVDLCTREWEGKEVFLSVAQVEEI
jgi:hypothetical protein